MGSEDDGAATNKLSEINEDFGRRGWTRTSDHLLRRQVLYPPELRARALFTVTFVPCCFTTTRQYPDSAQL